MLTTTLAAGPASAQTSFSSITPKVAPRVDVAQGALFETVARDSSGISFAESWKFVPAGNGEVFIVNRLLKNGAEVALDTQDTAGRRAVGPRQRLGGRHVEAGCAAPARSGRSSG